MSLKVIGSIALLGMCSAVGLFGIYLRAAESNPPPRPVIVPARRPVLPPRPPIIPVGQIGQFAGLGAINPVPPLNLVGQIGQVGQLGSTGAVSAAQPANANGQFGQIGGIGGIGKFGGIGQQLDLAGKKVIGIEDGPAQVLVSAQAVPTPPAKDEFVNPKVEPGRVKWHPDFDTACKAAAKSGKPVFLFQMMGKLDDQFC
jgi:hypothetical protein